METSVLDEYFGPRKETTEVDGQRPPRDELLARVLRGGRRWQCEDRIVPALDAFFECWPELTPVSGEMRRMHYHAARTLVEEIGEGQAPDFIRWARDVVSQTNRGMTIKTLRSLLYLVGRWRERKVAPSWYSVPCKSCGVIHPPGPCEVEEQPMTACPRCGVLSYHPDLPCSFHQPMPGGTQ